MKAVEGYWPEISPAKLPLVVRMVDDKPRVGWLTHRRCHGGVTLHRFMIGIGSMSWVSSMMNSRWHAMVGKIVNDLSPVEGISCASVVRMSVNFSPLPREDTDLGFASVNSSHALALYVTASTAASSSSSSSGRIPDFSLYPS